MIFHRCHHHYVWCWQNSKYVFEIIDSQRHFKKNHTELTVQVNVSEPSSVGMVTMKFGSCICTKCGQKGLNLIANMWSMMTFIIRIMIFCFVMNHSIQDMFSIGIFINWLASVTNMSLIGCGASFKMKWNETCMKTSQLSFFHKKPCVGHTTNCAPDSL